MKLFKYFTIIGVVALLTGCDAVKVATDYDHTVNFDQYETFAFYKPGIDKADISDIDKRRILRAIEAELEAKGLTKSMNPDLLVSIFTETKKNVNIYRHHPYGFYGYSWGWQPYYWGSYSTASTTIEGTLYIDLIDASKMQLIWQGMGTGALELDEGQKIESVNEIVSQILMEYPPGLKKK